MSQDEFLRKINPAPAIDVDEETAAELRSALAERGETISHEALKRELGLAWNAALSATTPSSTAWGQTPRRETEIVSEGSTAR